MDFEDISIEDVRMSVPETAGLFDLTEAATDVGTTETENNDRAYTSTGTTALDFFTDVNRSASVLEFVPLFIKMFNEDNELACKVLMHLRDPRGGKGEKFITQVILVMLKSVNKDVYEKLLQTVAVAHGCWKDVVVVAHLALLHGKQSDSDKEDPENGMKKDDSGDQNNNKDDSSADPKKKVPSVDISFEAGLIADQLRKDWAILERKSDDEPSPEDDSAAEGVTLCAKWAPSEGSKFGVVAKHVRNALKLSAREYRQRLSKLRKHLQIVELYLCSQEYKKIRFDKLPSQSLSKYGTAFGRSTNASGKHLDARVALAKRYHEYLEKARAGKVKMNVATLEPRQLVRQTLHQYLNDVKPTESPTHEAQWATITEKLASQCKLDSCLPVLDVSESMGVHCTEAGISLALLIANCNASHLRKRMVLFSKSATMFKLKGDSLTDQIVEVLDRAKGCKGRKSIQENTNLERVFDDVLDQAVMFNLAPEQMVQNFVVFSDLQFDAAHGNGSWKTTLQRITEKYEAAGYVVPKLIFWNLRASMEQRLKEQGAETGEVVMTLMWNNRDDLDLHVKNPNGEHIYYGHTRGKCGGHLDVDMNAGGGCTDEPVENIYWKDLKMFGEYKVSVDQFCNRTRDTEVHFEVYVNVRGHVRKFPGTWSPGGPRKLTVCKLNLQPPSANQSPWTHGEGIEVSMNKPCSGTHERVVLLSGYSMSTFKRLIAGIVEKPIPTPVEEMLKALEPYVPPVIHAKCALEFNEVDKLHASMSKYAASVAGKREAGALRGRRRAGY